MPPFAEVGHVAGEVESLGQRAGGEHLAGLGDDEAHAGAEPGIVPGRGRLRGRLATASA
jgi:hypothetical protein